jgi:nucleotide-binding universal stress UspA family protein
MKFLVAVDGSKNALKAVKTAIDLAKRLGGESSEIALISVHDDLALRNATHFVGKKAVDDYLASLSAQDMKSALAAAGKAGVRCTTLVKVGSVAAVIADTAQKDKFDMIVMGSKGRSAFKDLLIGSVAQRVSALATVPVLLVK